MRDQQNPAVRVLEPERFQQARVDERTGLSDYRSTLNNGELGKARYKQTKYLKEEAERISYEGEDNQSGLRTKHRLAEKMPNYNKPTGWWLILLSFLLVVLAVVNVLINGV